VVAVLVVLGLIYLAAWPFTPVVAAEYIENPMGENFTVAHVEQSLLKGLMSPRLSEEVMCATVQAWAKEMKTTLECKFAGPHTRGKIIEDDDEPSEYLWSEILVVNPSGQLEAYCFVSDDGGRVWELGSGLAFMGIFPIQTATQTCVDLRAGKYEMTEDAEIMEELDPDAPPVSADYPYYFPGRED